MQRAKWIWRNGAGVKNEYVDFYRAFVVEAIDPNAELYISADSEYVLFLNGTFLGCCQYDDYPDKKVYDTYSVGSLLREGENKIEIYAFYQGVGSFQYSLGTPGVWFCLKSGSQTIVSDEETLCRRSGQYQSGEHYMISRQLGFSFTYDAEGEDLSWENAVLMDVQTTLMARPIKNVEVSPFSTGKVISQGYFMRKMQDGTTADFLYKDYLSFRTVEEMFGEIKEGEPLVLKGEEGDGCYLIFDLEKESTGYLTLDVLAESGTVLEIGYGEHLKDLRVRTKIGIRNFAVNYRCKAGKNRFTHWFKRIAGRYLQVHIRNFSQIAIYGIGLCQANYPMEQIGHFSCDNVLHNRIFQVAVDTQRLCMHEHYEDCPWREQGLYAFDSRNQMLTTYYAFGEHSFARANLDLLAQHPGKDAQLRISAPTDDPMRIPTFSLWWLVEMKEYVEFSGDTTLAEEHWEQMEEMIATNVSWAQNDLVTPPGKQEFWNLYEWTDLFMRGKCKEMVLDYDGNYHLNFYIALQSVLWMAKRIGKAEFLETYEKYLEIYSESYCKTFWNEEKQGFASYIFEGEQQHYTEYAQALALWSGICKDPKKEKMLYQKLLCGNDFIRISLATSIFKYEALLRYNKECAKQVFDEIGARWGAMLEQGATSFWETDMGEADFRKAGSLCHAWTSTPVYLYMRYGAGICPDGGTETPLLPFQDLSAETIMNGKVIKVER